MPHQKRNFIEGQYYHITLRRVGGELMFNDYIDQHRFVSSLYEFNDNKMVNIWNRNKQKRNNKEEMLRGRPPQRLGKDRDLLVEIVAFCIMPTHIHLLVTPLQENGITFFMSKLTSGYASFFKNRHEIKSKGHFYQDRFHAVHVETDSQLRAVFVYIHTNPVSLIYPGWKEGAEIDAHKALDYCVNYKWSSLMDYLDIKNFPSVTQREFMGEFIGGAKGCRKEIREWLQHKEKMFERYEHFLIE